MTGYIYNGNDLLANNDFEPYYSLIDFGNESEWLYYNSPDQSKPQKLFAHSYALGGLDFSVGFSYKLWSRVE